MSLRCVQMLVAALAASAIAGGASAGTLIVNPQAAAGIVDLSELNLTVLNNLTAGGQETEGPTFVGGTFNLSGGYQVDFGTTANSGQGFVPSSFAGLTVGGSVTGGNLNIDSGKNISTPITPQILAIGGDDNATTSLNTKSTLSVGGKVSFINASSGSTVTAGGSISGNRNGATFVANQGASYQTGLSSSITSQYNGLATDFHALTTALSALTATGNAAITNSGNTLLITASDPNHLGYSVINVPIADLQSQNANIVFNNPNNLTLILNVTGIQSGHSYTINANDNDTTQDQLAIWNYGSTAATLAFGKKVTGSILAPYDNISNSTQLNGSVVALNFDQSGEVHLGTFNGVDPFTTSVAAVPEPATWAMMLLGLGGLGLALRARRQRPGVSAVAG